MDKLVRYAHGNGTRVVLSVGGWGGSKFFSVAVKSETSRLTFVDNLYQLLVAHNLDGGPSFLFLLLTQLWILDYISKA